MSTEKPQSTLYHYTSQKGLLGIVNNNEVWATDILYLNDTMEYKYAVDLASEIIKERQELCKDKTPSYAVYIKPTKIPGSIVPLPPYRYENKWIEYSMLEDFDEFIKEFKEFHIFVFSLSQEGNILSQWRGYCQNNNGYSIGFNPRALNRIINEKHFKLVKCIYDENDQKMLINDLVDKFINDIKTKLNSLSHSNNSRNDLVGEFLLSFLPIAPILKHKSFLDEQEWRLISKPIKTGSKKVKFREGTSTTIPYITINLKEEKHIPLEHIIIGPTGNEHLSKKAVDSLLASKNITNCKVDFSGIPYRPS
ncbi:MAG: DUF2971 domain-containing protein [Planctomycetes bacterium]|nr:DUF2971 domain-containing protein [Planctomycetota bacterium]